MLFVAVAFAASTGASSATAGAKRNETSASVTRELTLEANLIREINAFRVSHGLRRFTRSSALNRTAVGHSVAMATLGFFTHESLDGTPFWRRLKQLYVPHTRGWTVGENLAMFGGSPPPGERHRVRMDGLSLAPGEPVADDLPRGGRRDRLQPHAGGVFGGEPTWVVTLDVGRR